MSESKIWLSSLSRRDLLKFGLVAGAGMAASDLLAACGGSSSSPSSIQMRLGSDSPLTASHTVSMVKLKEEVETKSNGRIKCTIYPDGQLGANDVMLNSIKQGSLDAVMVDMSPVATAVPESGIFSLFFLFKDGQQALRAANGSTGAVLKPKIEQSFACEVLGWGTDGGHDMLSSKRAIRTPADLKGLKMRTPRTSIAVDTYTAFGALPTPLSITELYSALGTGVVDGTDVGPVDIVAFKFNEVTKYLTLTRHYNVVQVLVVSNKFMSKLSSQDKDVVRVAGKVAADSQASATFQEESGDVDLLKTKGIQVVEMSDPQSFVSIAKSVYAKNAAQLGGTPFIEQAANTP